MNIHRAACLSLIAGLSMLAAGEAAAVLGHDEAAAWRLLNQLRSDPRSSTFAITAHIQAGNAGFGTYSPRIGNFDWAHATGRMAATRPLPLDAQLNAIARALLAKQQDPPERKPIDVTALLAGAGRQAGDAVLALQSPPSPSLPIAFARAMLRINGIRTSTSRDSATFDAARVLDPVWTEAGVACRTSPAGVAVAFILGSSPAGRAVSGVVYQDEDRDGACSPGEGMAGAEVRIGELRTTTSAGGIWMLRLPAAGPATVAFATRDGSAQRPLAEDAAIADWSVPLQADCTQADRLLAAVTAAGGEQARMRARVQLLLGTRSARIDDDRRARV
ncbi:MAG: hypothetical protein J0M02_12445, partial [Planctomycetes bacterium]|nr:hypothetical protein [Planctomycetota bacterium]